MSTGRRQSQHKDEPIGVRSQYGDRAATHPPRSPLRPFTGPSGQRTTRRPPRTVFAFWLDAVLFVLFVLLRTPRLTGLSWHEWLGVAFLVPMVVHLLLSWRWIVTALRRVFVPARLRDAVNLLLNLSLFVTTAGVVVSGLLISRVALPALGITTIDDQVWRETHNNWTDAMLVSVGAHVAMNLKWIIRVADPYLPRWLKEAL